MVFAICVLPWLIRAQTAGQFKFECTEQDIERFGLVCSEDRPCAVFLDLASVEAFASRIFVAGNVHTVSTTLSGILLMSDDNGKSWSEPNGRIGAAALDQIQFADFEHGWVSGVDIEPLPRDPFILITADGGKTWRKQALFDETRFGTVHQFWFESAKNGELIFERSQGAAPFERLETTDGGESWSVRESGSKAMRLAKAPAKENATLRVRANSKALQIERRTTQNWEVVASFPIQVGECK